MTIYIGSNVTTGFTNQHPYDPGVASEREYVRLLPCTANAIITSLGLYCDFLDGTSVKLTLRNSSGVLLAVTSPISGVESPGFASGSIPPTAVVSGQNYYLGFLCNGTTDGARARILCDATFDSDFSTSGNYTSPAATISGIVDDNGYQRFLMYADGSSGRSGSMAAAETGSDVLAGSGTVGSNGVRLTLRDTDTGALAANLTGLIVSVRSASDATSMLASTTSGTTNSSGVFQLASTAIGSIGTYVYVAVEKSDHSVVAMFRMQVVDLNA